MENHPVKKVIIEAGGTGRVAKVFDSTDSAVSGWIKRQKIPVEHIIKVSELTGWKITPHMINPSIYPNPGDALPKRLYAKRKPRSNFITFQ